MVLQYAEGNLGPLLPSGYGRIEIQRSEERASINVEPEAFLGEMLAQHGKRICILKRTFLFEGFN